MRRKKIVVDGAVVSLNVTWVVEDHKSWLYSLNVSTTPLRQWGFRQCLPFSWLRGKHCWHPIAIMGVVDTFGLGRAQPKLSPHFHTST